VLLLEADSVRIDVGGVPVVETLTAKTSGNNVVVLGAPRALFEACSGVRAPSSGTLRVAGRRPRGALEDGLIASAPMDVPVPPRWTVLGLATESARLAGHGRRERVERAKQAVRALGLDAVATTRLGAAETAVKRAAMIAAALATGASMLVVEDFTAGLADAAARSLARLFVTACKDRRWLVFAGQLPLSSPLGLHADEALLFAEGRFVCGGPPAELAARERTYSLRTSGDHGALASHLRERGVTVDDHARALMVTLPDGFSTLDLVRLAVAESVVVLELLPVSSALV
jgi:ABC-type multidrug transport system ATPase subunit